MVMDCLRNAKRFLATVSFIADTGLKDASDDGKTLFSAFVDIWPFYRTDGRCKQFTSTTSS